MKPLLSGLPIQLHSVLSIWPCSSRHEFHSPITGGSHSGPPPLLLPAAVVLLPSAMPVDVPPPFPLLLLPTPVDVPPGPVLVVALPVEVDPPTGGVPSSPGQPPSPTSANASPQSNACFMRVASPRSCPKSLAPPPCSPRPLDSPWVRIRRALGLGLTRRSTADIDAPRIRDPTVRTMAAMRHAWARESLLVGWAFGCTPASSPPGPTEPVAVAPAPEPASSTELAARGTDRKAQALLDELVPKTQRIRVTEASAEVLEVQLIDVALWITDGTRRAPLGHRATALVEIEHVRNAQGAPSLVVDYMDDMRCDRPQRTLTLEAHAALARLENASAMRLHQAGDFVASARRFARAARLDPALDVAWGNLARALAMDGRTETAMTALAPLLRRAPLRTMHEVLRDPELAALRERPEIVALRAPRPGTASIHDLALAYSEHRSLVALRRTEQSWGSCSFVSELQLFDTESGQRTLTLPLIDWADSDPSCESERRGHIRAERAASVKANLDAADRFLRAMGFTVSEELEVVEAAQIASEPRGSETLRRARFARADLQIAILGDDARVLRDREVLGIQRSIDARQIERVGYDPEARVAFVQWLRDVPEGCDGGRDGAGFAVIPVAP